MTAARAPHAASGDRILVVPAAIRDTLRIVTAREARFIEWHLEMCRRYAMTPDPVICERAALLRALAEELAR